MDGIVQVGEEETALATELLDRVRDVLVDQFRIVLVLIIAAVDILLHLLMLSLQLVLLLVTGRDVYFELAHFGWTEHLVAAFFCN